MVSNYPCPTSYEFSIIFTPVSKEEDGRISEETNSTLDQELRIQQNFTSEIDIDS